MTSKKPKREILGILSEKGICEEDIITYIKSDINSDFIYTDVYCVITEKMLVILSGNPAFKSEDTAFFKKTYSFTEYEFRKYSLCSLYEFRIEKNISSYIFSATLDGEETLLFRFTSSLKDRMFAFLETLNKIKDGKPLTENDFVYDNPDLFCPKCGRKYPDSSKICPECTDTSKILKRISVFFLKYKLYIFLSFLSLVLITSLSTFVPYIGGSVFYDNVLSEGGKWYGKVAFAVGLIAATKFLNTLANVLSGVVTSKISAKVIYDIKKTVFSAISRLSMSFFTGRHTGGLMTSVNNDANNIYFFFCDGLPSLVVNAVQFFAITVIMFFINVRLAAFTFIMSPVFFIFYKLVFSVFGKMYAKNYSKSRSYNSVISDVLAGARVVKVFAKEKSEIERFDRKSSDFADSDKKINKFKATVFPLMGYLLYAGNFVVWAYGGWLTIKGQLSFGMLMTFIGYMSMIYAPISSFSEASRWYAECLNSISRIFEILDSIPEVMEKENPVCPESINGEITFSNVGFEYDKTRKILDGISFSVRPGEVLGIVGQSGAGKSTLVNLILRLYDTTEGEIMLDGINIKDMSLDALHKNIAIVSQETYLFRGTIMDNIRYANPKASDEEVFMAAKLADAHRFIIKYPESYETNIGWGSGKELSGGERQRISIARAFLKNPKILILDEATAAMDTKTERRIQQAIYSLSKGRTTLMIAHRLSTLKDADNLAVIKDGKICEYGTARQLIEKKGEYYKLYSLQLEAMKNIGI